MVDLLVGWYCAVSRSWFDGLRWCVGLRVYGGLCGLFWVVWFRLVVLVFRFVFWGGM